MISVPDLGLQAAIKACGDVAGLARRVAEAHVVLAIPGPAADKSEIDCWRSVPEQHVRAVAAASRVPRWVIRPDIYPKTESGSRHRDRGVSLAMAAAGSAIDLAWLLDITTQAIWQWTEVPVMRVRAIAFITRLPAHVFRPDVFGEPDVPAMPGASMVATTAAAAE